MLPQERGDTRCMSHLPLFCGEREGLEYSRMSINYGTKSLCILAIRLFLHEGHHNMHLSIRIKRNNITKYIRDLFESVILLHKTNFL